MKYIVARLSLIPILALIVSTTYAAGRYNPASGNVEFQCVSLVGKSLFPHYYSLTLAPQSDGTLSIAAVQDTWKSSECDASFSVDNNRLVSEVSIFDDIYGVELRFDNNSERFTLEFAEYRRLSETALWVVSNGVNSLYLGGTIHTLHESDYPLHPALLEAYELAETVVFEYDPAVPITSNDLESIRLPEGMSLLDYTSPGIELLLDEFLKQFGRTLNQYSNRRPFYFNTDLYYLGARSYGYISGVDFYFMDLAATDGKQTGGLETVGNQLQAISTANSDPNVDWNYAFIQRIAYIRSGQIDRDLRQLISWWREGRMDRITAGNEAYERLYPIQYENILASRNRNWIPVIESYLETPEVELILAGFSHFAGPDNVLGLLEELGYTVEKYIPFKSWFDDLVPNLTIDIPLF